MQVIKKYFMLTLLLSLSFVNNSFGTIYKDILVAGSSNGNIEILGNSDEALQTWKNIKKLKEDGSWVHTVAFNHDGTKLASGDSDGTIKIWNTSDQDPQNWKEPTILQKGGDWVMSVAFNHDGTKLASGSWNGTIKIWNTSDEALQTEQEPTILKKGGAPVLSVAFKPVVKETEMLEDEKERFDFSIGQNFVGSTIFSNSLKFNDFLSYTPTMNDRLYCFKSLLIPLL